MMGGWKTWVAGLGTIFGGLAMIAGALADGIDPDKIWQGFQMILAGLAIIGIGHKIEKAGK